MSAISKYLNELYLYEEISFIDESFVSLAKNIGKSQILKKLQLASKTKDLNSIRRILSAVPKIDPDKLRIIGKKANKDFDKAYKITEKECKEKFPKLKGDSLKYFSLIVTPFVVVSKNMEKTSKDKVSMLSKNAKKFGGGEATTGMFLAILAGIFGAAALANVSLFTLLIGIVIAGFAGLFIIEGAAG